MPENDMDLPDLGADLGSVEPACGDPRFPQSDDISRLSDDEFGEIIIDGEGRVSGISIGAIASSTEEFDTILVWSDDTFFHSEKFTFDPVNGTPTSRTTFTFAQNDAMATATGAKVQQVSATEMGFNFSGSACSANTPYELFVARLAVDDWQYENLTLIPTLGTCTGDFASSSPAFAGGLNPFNAERQRDHTPRWAWLDGLAQAISLDDSFDTALIKQPGPAGTDWVEIFSTTGPDVFLRATNQGLYRWEAGTNDTPTELPNGASVTDIVHLDDRFYATLTSEPSPRLVLSDYGDDLGQEQDHETVSVDEPLLATITAYVNGIAVSALHDEDGNGKADTLAFGLYDATLTTLNPAGTTTHRLDDEFVPEAMDSVALVNGCNVTIATAVLYRSATMTQQKIDVFFATVPGAITP